MLFEECLHDFLLSDSHIAILKVIAFSVILSQICQKFSIHSTKARSKRYFQVFLWFGRPNFAFRRKCVRDAARIVCFCNLTTFFLTIILLARSLAFADLQSYNSCVFLGSLFFSPIWDRKLSFSSVPSFFFICRDWMSAISHTVSKPTYFLLHCTVNQVDESNLETVFSISLIIGKYIRISVSRLLRFYLD